MIACLLDLPLTFVKLLADTHCLILQALLFFSLSLKEIFIVVVLIRELFFDVSHDFLTLLSQCSGLALLVSLFGLLKALESKSLDFLLLLGLRSPHSGAEL